MFDLGFSELVVCFVIALVVLGPTRLPGLVAKIGRWIGKARAMARQFREQLESEINLDELNRATEKRAKEARETTPAPPPEFSGDPPATTISTDTTASTPADSGYPYAPQAPAPEATAQTAPAASPQPGDDTYSHAHGAGEAPVVADTPESATPATSDSHHPAT